jgi:pyruvate ferredoxin oxidoreductase gamma subunit
MEGRVIAETTIRWHGRAQHGTKTAVKLLSQGVVLEGRYVQSYPDFHYSHLGEPATHYTRIRDVPFVQHCPPVSPSIVVVLDADLIVSAKVANQLSVGGLILANSPSRPELLQRGLGLGAYWVSTLDGTAIALEYLGEDLPNVALLGALSRLTGIVKLQTLAELINLEFGPSMSEEMVNANILALQRGHSDVQSTEASIPA